MRIIHTSDWHLGRRFGPVSLSSDQEAFADWFVDLVADQGADLVVIAGDLYDRAVAPTPAIELFRDTVRRLLATGAEVAAITGNHDGPDRVASYDDLLDHSGLLLRGGYAGAGRVLRRHYADGPLDLVLVPYLDPQMAPDGYDDERPDPAAAGDRVGAGPDTDDPHADPAERPGRRGRTHHSVLAASLARARAGRTAPRSVAVAHAFVAGGAESESERQLTVGGAGQVDAALFGGFSYVALGHLHRPQQVLGPTVRYSGTPLPYSFSEDHEKSVAVVDLDAGGAASVELVEVGVGRAVATLTGTIDELLDRRAHPEAHDRFVRAVLTDRTTVLDAKARLAEVYPHVVEVRLAPAGVDDAPGCAPTDRTRISPLELTRRFWEVAEGEPPDAAVAELLADAVRAATREVAP